MLLVAWLKIIKVDKIVLDDLVKESTTYLDNTTLDIFKSNDELPVRNDGVVLNNAFPYSAGYSYVNGWNYSKNKGTKYIRLLTDSPEREVVRKATGEGPVGYIFSFDHFLQDSIAAYTNRWISIPRRQ